MKTCSECNPQGYPDPIPPFVPCPHCSGSKSDLRKQMEERAEKFHITHDDAQLAGRQGYLSGAQAGFAEALKLAAEKVRAMLETP